MNTKPGNRRRKLRATVAAGAVLSLALAACSASGSQEELPVSMASFFGAPRDAASLTLDGMKILAKFGGSEVLKAAGYQNSTERSFTEVETQMSQLQTQMQTLINEGTYMIGDLNEISAQLTQLGEQELADNLQAVVNEQNTYYTDFDAYVQTAPDTFLTPAEIAANQEVWVGLGTNVCQGGSAIGTVADCAPFLNTIVSDVENMVGTANPPGPTSAPPLITPGMASQVFGYVNRNFTSNLPSLTAPASDYDLAAEASATNETVVAYLTQFLSIMQQDYNIMATLLYLKYCGAPGSCNPEDTAPTPAEGNPFAEVVLPIPGFLNEASASDNLQALNTYFTNEATALQNAAEAAMVSDTPAGVTPAAATQALTALPGVPGGSWRGACVLYAWPVLYPNNFAVNYTGDAIQPACFFDGAAYPGVVAPMLNFASSCQNPQGTLSAKFWPGMGGSPMAMSCDSGIKGSPFAPLPVASSQTWSSGATLSQKGVVSFHMPMPAGSSFGGASWIQTPYQSSRSWLDWSGGTLSFEPYELPTGYDQTFQATMSIPTPDGYNASIVVSSVGEIVQDTGSSYRMSFTTQLSCDGDPMCGGVNPDGSICVGGSSLGIGAYGENNNADVAWGGECLTLTDN